MSKTQNMAIQFEKNFCDGALHVMIYLCLCLCLYHQSGGDGGEKRHVCACGLLRPLRTAKERF